MSTPSTTEPLRGEKLLRTAVNQILAHPETWNQSTWHCGTQHCIGGWCQILGGFPQDESKVREDAASALALSREDSAWLFSGNRTLGDIYKFAKNYSTVLASTVMENLFRFWKSNL